ncbi:MAG TPA: nuclear transport factor 2 family protein [Flavobacterium sp.]|jgi:hypothetical protein
MKTTITTALILFVITARSQNNIQHKMEKQIKQTISDVFNGADERNWKKVQNAMAENVLLDYSSLSGNPEAILPSKQIVATWKAFLPGFDRTRHQLSNFQIKQKGNMASVHFDGKADHFISKEIWTVEGNYDAEVAKTNNQWVVTKLKFNFLKQSGNTNLPSQASNTNSK